MKQIVLMYHDVYQYNPNESGFASDLYKLDVHNFEEQVKALANLRDNKMSSLRILLTFDDGGSSFSHLIMSILDKYGFKGYFFISTNYIGQKGFLNHDEIIDLYIKGHYIGSHSHTHPENISKYGSEDLLEEWVTSIKILSEIIKNPVTIASVPNGYCTTKVIEAARKAGVVDLYTSIPKCTPCENNGLNIVGRYVVLSDTTPQEVLGICTSNTKRFLMLLNTRLLSLPKIILGENYENVKSRILRLIK